METRLRPTNSLIKLTAVVAALVLALGIVLGAVITEFAAGASLNVPEKQQEKKGLQGIPGRRAPLRPDSYPSPLRAHNIEMELKLS